MKEIIIATKNPGKVREFVALFKHHGIHVKSLLDLEHTVPEIEETGTTFKENARLKAEGIANVLNVPVIADDSGLSIDALNGEPGVYSARYAGEPADDIKNYEKVLHEMRNIPDDQRMANFVCILAFALPNKETIFTKGICKGKIAHQPAGTNGFGYDPIFIPENNDQTMAQLSEAEKNKISHRHLALVQLEKGLRQNLLKGE